MKDCRWFNFGDSKEYTDYEAILVDEKSPFSILNL